MILQRGSRGPEVRHLQERLVELGFLVGPADGDFGPMTLAAVVAFQRARSLQPDGRVGPQTSAALGSGSGTSPGAPPLPVPGVDDFHLVAVETPGGGRIQDKTEPSAADLVEVRGYEGRVVALHRWAAQAWSALTLAARQDGVAAPYLEPVSGHRSVAQQQRTWDRAVERYGSEAEARRWVARPGGSAHHSGRAVDCWLGSGLDSGNVDQQRLTAAWRWLDREAERFGCYPYAVEPWHWEYNPPAT